MAETFFPAAVIRFDPLPKKLTANERLYYGQYDKANATMIGLLKDLTGGRFENGAVARILARKFWSEGKAPTFKEYARAWLSAAEEHTAPNPEWAFLSDRAMKRAGANWKELRSAKARKAMETLNRITTVSGD